MGVGRLRSAVRNHRLQPDGGFAVLIGMVVVREQSPTIVFYAAA